MMKKRVIKLSLFNPSANDKAVRELQDYAKRLEEKGRKLAQELALHGFDVASITFDNPKYDGQTSDVSMDIREIGDNKYAIFALGETAVIVEFGGGAKYGYGHPLADKVTPQMGPGTHPDPHYGRNSKGELVQNWENDRGWYIPKAKGGGHTFGNPPNMGMYNASKAMRDELLEIARKVFQSEQD